MYPHVIARRRPGVMFAPAPCAVIPEWKLAAPAFMGTATGAISGPPCHSGYSSKSSPRFSPIPALRWNSVSR